ncbi:MAG: FHA domain-containing protein [Chloroflexaceae bacterium]|nr:FHA domain-containing protein [Chloroflexaceae bacterium]
MFDLADLSLGVIILLLRVAVVFLLYLFLWQVLRVVTHDLRGSATPAMERANQYGQLIVVSSGQTGLPVGKTFLLNPVNIIGRSLENDIALNDTFLSSQHTRLELRNGEWVVEDMNSTNGTFVNGFEVRGTTTMRDGDVIRLGRIELKLVEPREREHHSPNPA